MHTNYIFVPSYFNRSSSDSRTWAPLFKFLKAVSNMSSGWTLKSFAFSRTFLALSLFPAKKSDSYSSIRQQWTEHRFSVVFLFVTNNSSNKRKCLPSPRSIWAAVIWTIAKYLVLIRAIVIIVRASSGSCSLRKLGKNICFTAKTIPLLLLMEDKKNSWIESAEFLFELAALNSSNSKAVINFWKSMVTNSLRLPLEESKIDNKPSICPIFLPIVRGNRLLKIIYICTIKEKGLYWKMKLWCTNCNHTLGGISFEQTSDHHLHSPGITVGQIFGPWILVRKLYIVSHVIGVLKPIFRGVSICFNLSQPGWVICRTTWKLSSQSHWQQGVEQRHQVPWCPFGRYSQLVFWYLF